MNGILVADKPIDMTSAEVVRRAKRQFSIKVGHLGTLDPFATGVLPLCLGEATKIAQFLNTADKEYEGVLRLGVATDTGDRTGSVVRSAAVPELSDAKLRDVERRFQGLQMQVPPMYSALKHQGVPLYRLARKGIEVGRAPRQVRIDRLRLERESASSLRFAVACSKGTYVRVLAEDLGAALGTVAHLAELRRTRFGPFAIADAVRLVDGQFPVAPRVHSIRESLAEMPTIGVDAVMANDLRRGRVEAFGRLPELFAGDSHVLIVGPGQEPVAVLLRRGRHWSFARVFAAPAPE